MPRISAGTIADHRARVWASLVEALDELLSEREYEQISLADIAAKAGIARSSAYNYASDKDALLAAAVAESSEVMIDEIRAIASREATAPVRLSAIVDYLLSTFAQGSRRLFVLQARQAVPSADPTTGREGFATTLMGTIAYVIRDGIAEGHFHDSDTVEFDVDLLTGMVDRAVTAIAVRGQDPKEVSSRTKELLLRALLRDGRADS